MKAVVATIFLALFALAGVQAQYAAPPPASGGLGGACGMYLSACCPGNGCQRGFVCTTGLAATPVCYTPRCTDTQQCMGYAYWTECIVEQMNCNACGFIGQKQCSLQNGQYKRTQPCYQGMPVNGYCVGSAPPPPPPRPLSTPYNYGTQPYNPPYPPFPYPPQ